MIKKIVIRDVASYDHEGCTFDNLSRVNIIYGGNGTGKTTLSREVKENNPWGENERSEVVWAKAPENVLVYNKEFKEENLQEQVPGVFVMGEEWVALAKQSEKALCELEKLKKKADRAAEKIADAQRQKEMGQYKLEEYLWGKLYEPYQDFKELIGGYAQKASFAERMKYEMWQRERNEEDKSEGATTAGIELRRREPVKDVEELRRLYKELYDGVNAHVDKNDLKNGCVFFEREILRFQFWRFLLSQVEPEVKKAVEVQNACENKLERLKKDEEKIRRAIEELTFEREGGEKMSRSIQPVIDSINSSLEYYGFTGFSIQKAPKYNNCLQIQRNDGSLASLTLSEGEATFITLLYFMMQATCDTIGVGNTMLKQVMVIDDPVSSLDDSVAHVVAVMIKDLAMRIYANDWKRNEHKVTQLIVMTHNYRFYKMLTGELRRKDVKRWLLTKENGVSKVKKIDRESPVKEEYVVLWEIVREVSGKMEEGTCDMRDIIELPNTIRKILERYFVEYGGYERLGLLALALKENPNEMMMAQSLLKWADEGSHSTGEYQHREHPVEVAKKYLDLFRKVFVKLGQEAHYRMMMRDEKPQ